MTQDKEPLQNGSEKKYISENETGLDRLKQRLFRPGVLISVFVAVLCGMGLVIHLLVSSAPPAPVVMEPEESVILQAVSPEARSQRVYEEAFGGLEELVKQADFALLEALRASGIDMQRLELDEVSVRSHAGQDYHFQRLRIPGVKRRDAFLLTLQKSLAQRVPNAFLTGDGDHVSLMVGDINTHEILLDGAQQKSAAAVEYVNGPKLVVVIDDVGENMKVLKGLLSIDLPLVYAVWPASSHMSESVRLLRKAGRDILVHFPMQPKGYPQVDPGEGALFVTMSAKKIRDTVRRYTAMIPEAIGANNHMGSLFTENKPGMRAALKEFKKRRLFFLDSMTTPNSVVRSVARSIAIPYYKRNVFLDNVKDVSAIVHQLHKAERIAQSRGQAIAIGHPHPATLAAIRQWATRRNTKVAVIPLSQLKPEFSGS